MAATLSKAELRSWVARALRNRWRLVIDFHFASTGGQWSAQLVPPEGHPANDFGTVWHGVTWNGLAILVPEFLIEHHLHDCITLDRP